MLSEEDCKKCMTSINPYYTNYNEDCACKANKLCY